MDGQVVQGQFNADNVRLLPLDGLRGVAVLMVVVYHAYARWPELYPFGPAFRDFAPFKLGHLGVQLFFLISGFVILMTLEKCGNIRLFLVRRWLRLFPAMLLCSAIIFLSAPLFPERPAGQPTFSSLIPGLLFADPYWLTKIFGGYWDQIEGAFWSLYVEAQFYIVFGSLFFLVGRGWSIIAITAIFCMSNILFYLISPSLSSAPELKNILHASGFMHYGWFSAGAIFYIYSKEGNARNLATGIIVALASALAMVSWEWRLGSFLIVAAFVGSISSKRLGSIVANPILLFFGFISYPLYLLHENAMVAMTIKVGTAFPGMPGISMPLGPILIVIGIAWIVAAFGERKLRAGIRIAASQILAAR
jgi:peptidoglycan/LPS O-acetylase OafA/YrhL